MEKSGIKISEANLRTLLDVIDFALRMQYSGALIYDKSNNVITIQSKHDNNKPVLPWAVLLCLYLKCIWNDSKIIQILKQGSSDGMIHIKLSKPIP
jgi:hypothetical protein